MSTDLSELSIAELKEKKATAERSSTKNSDHIEEELARRRERREQEAELLDLKVKLEEARSRGLTDDLTVTRIEEQIRDLASVLETDPRADLAHEAAVPRDHVAHLSIDEAEDALERLEALEKIETAPENSIMSEGSAAEENRAELEAIVEGGDATAAALEEGYLSDETGDDMAVALLEEGDIDETESTDGVATDRDVGPSPQEELAEETGLSEEQAAVYSDRQARDALDVYKDLEALEGLPHAAAREKYEEKVETLAELAADVDADEHRAALSVPDAGV